MLIRLMSKSVHRLIHHQHTCLNIPEVRVHLTLGTTAVHANDRVCEHSNAKTMDGIVACQISCIAQHPSVSGTQQ